MEYDPFSPVFQADPFPVYRWMRDEAPVFYSEKWNWWALSRFDDVRAAALDPDTYLSFEGIDIDDTAKDQNPPGFLPNVDNPRHDQIRAVVQPPLLPGRDRRARGRRPRHRAQADRRLAPPRLRRPRPGAGLAAAQRGVLRPARAARVAAPTGPGSSAGCTSSRTASPTTPGSPPSPRRPPRASSPTSSTCCNERRRNPRADLVTHLVNAEIDGVPFADEHIDDASEIMGLMLVLFLGGVESTAGPGRHAVQAARREPRPARDPAREPRADPRRRRGGHPHRHPVAAGRAHDVARGHAARRDDPRGRARRAGLRRRQPRRAPLRRSRPLRRHPRPAAPPRLRRGHARLHRRAAGPAGGQDRAGGSAAALGDYTVTDVPERYSTTPNMYVWEHLHLAFPVTDAPVAPRPPRPRRDGEPPHRHHRRHP